VNSGSPLEQAQEFIEVMLGKRLSHDFFWVFSQFCQSREKQVLSTVHKFSICYNGPITIIVK